MPVNYLVKIPDAVNHLFEVTLRVNVTQGLTLVMPAWIPGSYMIRDFAKNILQIKASCEGKEIALTKKDKQTWQSPECSGLVEITYSVYAWDLSVRTAHLDLSHGFFNGTSLFLKVIDQELEPCTVSVLQPNGKWQLATGMSRVSGKHFGFGQFKANNYQDLIGYPFEMGNFTTGSFIVKGIRHDIVFTGKHYADIERICSDLSLVCEQHLNLFKEAPFEHYTFLVMVTGDGYGGLEHCNSTSLLCSRGDLPSVNEPDSTKAYRNFLGLCSHEYFHAWNVKGIKPQEVLKADLSQEAYFTSLWIFEGITSYYDDLALLRCGLITEKQYLEVLGKTLTRLLQSQGRKIQSLHESSFDAWTKFYQQDENAVNAIISYYVKGAVLALWLDLTLRHDKQGGSLDLVMQDFWANHKGQGIVEADFFASIAKVSGEKYITKLQQLLTSTKDIKVPFETMGLDYCRRVSSGVKDLGGTEAEKSDKFSLGFAFKAHPKGLQVLNVVNGSPAQKAGLASQDVIIAIDKLAVNEGNYLPLLNRFASGNKIKFHVFRRDELYNCQLKLKSAIKDKVYIKVMNEKSESREQWWKKL